MTFAILRIKKHKSINSIIGVSRHHNREIECPTADPSLKDKNIKWGSATSDSKTVGRKVSDLISSFQAKVKRKFRSDAVKAVEFMLTASPEFFKDADPKKKTQFVKIARKFLEEKFGPGCVVAEWLHMDESTPHLHAFIVPIDPKGVLNARHFFGSAEKLSTLQSEFATAVESLGLQRGIKGSKTRHEPVKKFWQRVDQGPKISLKPAQLMKAALGFEVPELKTMQEQASKFHILKSEMKKIFDSKGLISKRSHELDQDRSILRTKQELFTKESYKFDQLQRENRQLRETVLKYEKPIFIPTLQNLGLQ